MFCSKCGKENKDDANFCKFCGSKVTIFKKSQNQKSDKDFFYSKDWVKPGFRIASIPHFDILINRNYLYLIKLPKSSASTAGFIVGFLFFFAIFGAAIGVIIGNSIERNKRERFRSCWINATDQLITDEYENNYRLKMSFGDFKNNFTLAGKKLEIAHNGKTFVLKGKREEINRLLQYVNKN